MVRKQLYLEAAQERKLKNLAARWRCSEAAVVRKALANLPEKPRSSDQEVLDRLIASGVVLPPRGPRLTAEEDEEIERELDELAAAHPGLADPAHYVAEDREGR